MTPKQLASEYLTHKQALGNAYKTEEVVLRAFCKHLGDRAADSITLAQMQDFLHTSCNSTASVARRQRVISGFTRMALT